jgi:multidrug efflux pump subunit AcrA (membrane-fusion protein)
MIAGKESGEVKSEDTATITVEAFPNRAFPGRVTQVRPLPHVIENVAAREVVITVPNPDLMLKPGMAATIKITTE